VIVTTDKNDIYPGSETTSENEVLTGMCLDGNTINWRTPCKAGSILSYNIITVTNPRVKTRTAHVALTWE